MSIDEINNMTREQLIEYAKNFNIFKTYDYPEFLNIKNAILERIEYFNINKNELYVQRHINENAIAIINTYRNKIK